MNSAAQLPPDTGLQDSALPALRSEFGYNELPQKHDSLILLFLGNFWNPLAWIMEITILITAFSGNVFESLLIAALLCANSFINLFERRSADKALAALSRSVQINVRVLRDDAWKMLPARELLPGDIMRLRTGDVVPADAVLLSGDVQVDLSSLTGESLPQDLTTNNEIYSGGIIRHGEATTHVSAIGIKTKFGKTTELLEVAHPPTHMEKVVFKVIRYLFLVNMLVAVVVVVFGLTAQVQTIQIINFVIVILLTSVPVAFPTMFAVAQSYGALQLSRKGGYGVLVRRLAAVQEAASMNVLCTDKTGTLTQDRLSVAEVRSLLPGKESELLAFAAAASDVSDEDPIDTAVLQYARQKAVVTIERTSFTPFDFATKRTEAQINVDGKTVHIEKGLPDLLLTSETILHSEAFAAGEDMSSRGMRVLAVVAIRNGIRECVGVIGLADPIREDAPQLIKELVTLGIRIIMITGDGRTTAKAIAEQLGLGGEVFTAQELKTNPGLALTGSVCAEAYPEDKLAIIDALQKAGHVVGMTGDGVNDAPALHQAEVGIAVENATEVAKQSASFILTNPGLESVRDVLLISRSVYLRIHTWVVNKIVKSIEVLLITTLVFFVTRSYILSPLLGVLILIANDFVSISIATDRTTSLPFPAKWRVGALSIGSAIIALVPFALMLGIYVATSRLGYPIDVLRTIVFTGLVYFSGSTLLAIRTPVHAWSVPPSRTLIIALTFSLTFVSLISGFGILIAPLPVTLFLPLALCGVLNFFAIDAVKQIQQVQTLLYK